MRMSMEINMTVAINTDWYNNEQVEIDILHRLSATLKQNYKDQDTIV